MCHAMGRTHFPHWLATYPHSKKVLKRVFLPPFGGFEFFLTKNCASTHKSCFQDHLKYFPHKLHQKNTQQFTTKKQTNKQLVSIPGSLGSLSSSMVPSFMSSQLQSICCSACIQYRASVHNRASFLVTMAVATMGKIHISSFSWE